MEITAKTGFNCWIKALEYILKQGEDFIDDDKRRCREVRNILLVVKEPGLKPSLPVDTLRSFQKWYYPDHEEIRKAIFDSKISPGYSFSLGPRLFDFRKKINQIDDFIIPLLKIKKTSRRATAIIWDPVEDSLIHKKDIPSLMTLSFMIRQNKLFMTAYVRSNDLFFGYPSNLYQCFRIMKYVLDKISVEFGDLAIFSFSAHIFDDEFEDIKKLIAKNQKV